MRPCKRQNQEVPSPFPGGPDSDDVLVCEAETPSPPLLPACVPSGEFPHGDREGSTWTRGLADASSLRMGGRGQAWDSEQRKRGTRVSVSPKCTSLGVPKTCPDPSLRSRNGGRLSFGYQDPEVGKGQEVPPRAPHRTSPEIAHSCPGPAGLPSPRPRRAPGAILSSVRRAVLVP